MKRFLPAILGVMTIACGLGVALADYYAAQNGQAPASPYTTWATAASNIQDAVNAASPNATVWVGAGRYTVPTNAVISDGGTNVVYLNRLMTLRGSNGVPADTIIDGQGSNRGVAVYYAADNLTNWFVLDGFTITNCFAKSGAGINFSPNAMTWTGYVQNCVITHNTSTDSDGAIYVYNGFNTKPWTLVASNVVIRNNSAVGLSTYPYFGENGGVRLTDCLIENNLGGLNLWRGSNVVRNCVIRDNYKTAVGAGMYLAYGKHMFINCLFYNNADVNATPAIIYSSYSVPEFYNCTIVSNSGRGLHAQTDKILVWNSIVYSNSAANFTLTVNFTNSCVTPTNSTTGPGNITNYPRFVNFVGHDFRLAADSPCINRGLNQDWMAGAGDLDGRTRKDRFTGVVDPGCYEYLPRGLMFIVR
jgi:hypothetical protein